MAGKPGTPNARRDKGRGAEFLRANVAYAGDDCLTWILKGRDGKGYGQVAYGGKLRLAHRVMCILAHGEPPTPEHHAAHSCGKGHEACVNPRHLSWKTASENQADTVTHGTCKKKGGTRQKLTDEQVAEIRAWRGIRTQKALGELYCVRPETIGQIQRYEYRKGTQPHLNQLFDHKGGRAALKAEARRMLASGMSYTDTAKKIGFARSTVFRLVTDYRPRAR
jgi:hypothetical protein